MSVCACERVHTCVWVCVGVCGWEGGGGVGGTEEYNMCVGSTTGQCLL